MLVARIGVLLVVLIWGYESVLWWGGVMSWLRVGSSRGLVVGGEACLLGEYCMQRE